MIPPHSGTHGVLELSLPALIENPENSDYSGQHQTYSNAVLLARFYEFCAGEQLSQNIAFLMSIQEWIQLEPGSHEELQKLAELYHYFISSERPNSVLVPFFNKKLPNVNLPNEILHDFPQPPNYLPDEQSPQAYSKSDNLAVVREKIIQAKRHIETYMRIEIQIRFINSVIALPSLSVSPYTTQLVETYKNNLIDMKKAKKSWESRRILKSNLINNIVDDVISVSNDYVDNVIKPKNFRENTAVKPAIGTPSKSVKDLLSHSVTSLFWFRVKKSEDDKRAETDKTLSLEETALNDLQESLKKLKTRFEIESLTPDDTAKKLIHEIKKTLTQVPHDKRTHKVWQHLQENLNTLENFSLLGNSSNNKKTERY